MSAFQLAAQAIWPKTGRWIGFRVAGNPTGVRTGPLLIVSGIARGC